MTNIGNTSFTFFFLPIQNRGQLCGVQVKPLSAVQASHVGAGSIPAAPLAIQLQATVPEKAGMAARILRPLHRQPGPAPGTMAILGVN